MANVEDASETARRLGFPVVLKGLAPDKVHKTELGLVKLGLRDPADLGAAYRDLKARLNGTGRILLQKQVPLDLELICGMGRDPQLGPSVLFGLGGVTAELHKDVVFRVAPLSLADAYEMMDSIRGRAALNGFHAKKPVDREALARVLVALGQIGLEAPTVGEIGINPMAVADGTPVALDTTVVLGDA